MSDTTIDRAIRELWEAIENPRMSAISPFHAQGHVRQYFRDLEQQRDAALAEAAARKAEAERLRGLLRHFVGSRKSEWRGQSVIAYEVTWNANNSIHEELQAAAYPFEALAATPAAKETT